MSKAVPCLSVFVGEGHGKERQVGMEEGRREEISVSGLGRLLWMCSIMG